MVRRATVLGKKCRPKDERIKLKHDEARRANESPRNIVTLYAV